MGREEQIEEREVLDSIFPDEIQGMYSKERLSVPIVCLHLVIGIPSDITADTSDTSFRISVLLDVTNDGDDQSPAPTILLSVTFTDNYPDEAPTLDVLTAPGQPSYAYLDLNEDKEQLLESLNQTIEENLGMQMIFTLQSALKENAEALIAERQAGARLEEEKRILALEAEENKKFHGTPVNAETFVKWRDEFVKEMALKRLEEEQAEDAAELKRNRGKEKVVGLTGKQLWERGMAGKFVEEEEEGAVPTAELQKVKV